MTRKLFALTVAALMLAAWGQSGRLRADGPVVVQAYGQDGCCRDRGCCHGGVCRPVTEIKKVEKRDYTDICEQFCLPKCFGLGLFGGGCGGCGAACEHGEACHQCGHVRVRKYLILKIKHEEKCVPACQVDCAAPCAVTPMPHQ